MRIEYAWCLRLNRAVSSGASSATCSPPSASSVTACSRYILIFLLPAIYGESAVMPVGAHGGGRCRRRAALQIPEVRAWCANVRIFRSRASCPARRRWIAYSFPSGHTLHAVSFTSAGHLKLSRAGLVVGAVRHVGGGVTRSAGPALPIRWWPLVPSSVRLWPLSAWRCSRSFDALGSEVLKEASVDSGRPLAGEKPASSRRDLPPPGTGRRPERAVRSSPHVHDEPLLFRPHPCAEKLPERKVGVARRQPDPPRCGLLSCRGAAQPRAVTRPRQASHVADESHSCGHFARDSSLPDSTRAP